MAPTIDAQTTEERAHALLENRMSSVRAVVATRARLEEARELLARAEADDVRAYRAALSDGWAADELRKIGIDEPAKSARVRRRSTARKAAAPEPVTNDQGNAPSAPVVAS